MSRLDRRFFAEIARAHTEIACLATTLSVGCESSGHGPVADPADVEARLWGKIGELRAEAEGLLAAREPAQLGADTLSQAPQMLLTRYQGLVGPEDAAVFWALAPQRCGKELSAYACSQSPLVLHGEYSVWSQSFFQLRRLVLYRRVPRAWRCVPLQS